MSITHKRAALELHSLTKADREWVLGRLAPAEQSRVKPLLAELDRMNIRFDLEADAKRMDGQMAGAKEIEGQTPGAARANGQGGHGPHSTSADAPSATARSLIRDASVPDVLRALANEPAWLVNALLALDTWPWSTAVRQALAQKGVLRPGAPTAKDLPVTPMLGEELVALVAERLRAPDNRANGHANGDHSGINGIGVWHRVSSKVRQWLP